MREQPELGRVARKDDKAARDIRKVFTRNFRRLLVERGYEKQWAFAMASGIKPSAVSEYLRGRKTPRLDTLQRIAEVLDVEYAELLKPR